MAASGRVPIPGSERQPDAAHARVDDADANKQITVTAYLRGSAPLDWVDEEASKPATEQRRTARDAWAAAQGAREGDVAAVRAFAAEAGLTVGEVDLARGSVELQGTVAAVAAAFEAQGLGLFEHPTAGKYRGRQGVLTVPAALDGVIVGVFGIDERPQAQARLRKHPSRPADTSYTPVQIAEAYDFPTDVTGKDVTVGIIELEGGFREQDLADYFAGLGLPTPSVVAVGVDGGQNSPGVEPHADIEVMLDIEVVGAVAPDASIVVYFANTSDQGFLDAVSTAVHDSTHKPSIVSISWGGSEDAWTGQARKQMDRIFAEAAGLGVTITVAAGDGGSTDGVEDGEQHVDFPASSPHALACGGTSLQTKAAIESETVWNDGSGGGATGGGVSRHFARPAYQHNANVPENVDTGKHGRGVPDVAGDADPATGYKIRVDGADEVIGGTSAVAPLWAGLLALINQSLGTSAGFVNPRLYAAGAEQAFHDITVGNNGAYSAGPGWDACTGQGSPIGVAVRALL